MTNTTTQQGDEHRMGSETEGRVIVLDGGVLEGGGQVVRLAVALSVLLTKPISIFNIRKNRSSPGLKAQHAAGTCLSKN